MRTFPSIAAALFVFAIAGPLPYASAAQPCLAPGAWYTLASAFPLPVAAHDILSEMARREVVLLGENHRDADHHRWQLQTLAALHLMRPHMVIGFEVFPRRTQPVLDQWIAGELSPGQFLERVEWKKIWNMPAELYLPLLEFARMNRIPIVALNVERSLTSRIAASGWDAIPAERKEGLSRPAAAAEAYVNGLFDVYARHAAARSGGAQRGESAFRFFVEAQTTWDRAFAEALAARVTPHAAPRPLAVGIVGAGHVRHGHGVAHQLRDLGVRRIGTLLPAEAGTECAKLERNLADAVFALPRTKKSVAAD